MTDITALAQRIRNYLDMALKSGVKLSHLTTDELSGLLDELGAAQARITELESRPVTVKLPEEAVDQVCLAAAEIHNRGNGVSDDKAQFIINRIRNYLENGGELKGAGIQVIEGEGQ